MTRRNELRIEDVRALLKERCNDAGGQTAFAAAHGLNVQYVSQVLLGRRPPSAAICNALGIVWDGPRWIAKE